MKNTQKVHRHYQQIISSFCFFLHVVFLSLFLFSPSLLPFSSFSNSVSFCTFASSFPLSFPFLPFRSFSRIVTVARTHLLFLSSRCRPSFPFHSCPFGCSGPSRFVYLPLSLSPALDTLREHACMHTYLHTSLMISFQFLGGIGCG